jgi:hypothetical protein
MKCQHHKKSSHPPPEESSGTFSVSQATCETENKRREVCKRLAREKNKRRGIIGDFIKENPYLQVEKLRKDNAGRFFRQEKLGLFPFAVLSCCFSS